ncbi:glycosyltransferase family 2 protein [Desulfonatronum thiodismutans]|uniref:glycosyltransferase family 2 protein n=1 Tax=Desulfonatronum thiodismutans TaxID=159290 RepID=UPI00068D8328|nr:glycosyltransferase family 2 protein [Desulfonatronum thiodismutans]
MPPITIITPNKNGERFLEQTVRSVLNQRFQGINLEYIVLDGASTDRSLEIIDRYKDQIDVVISEPDTGPAAAINKGLRMARGEIIAWLNADDVYHPNALARVLEVMDTNPKAALCFGSCRIIGERDQEIRRPITRFKELFFPLSSRFTIQCINYISQPAMFFRRSALEQAGPLREDLKAAFDYDLTLRLWRHGGAVRVPGAPLADFRWHQSSISGSHFQTQFREELQAAAQDAGPLAPQTLIHQGVRWGIVGIYGLMAMGRSKDSSEHPAKRS